MTKLMLMLMMVAGAALVAPQPAAAAECTDGYTQCLNDTYDTEGVIRVLADLECGVRYTACLMAVIKEI